MWLSFFIQVLLEDIFFNFLMFYTKQNKYNCSGSTTFKSHKYKVGYQSDQKLLHHY